MPKKLDTKITLEQPKDILGAEILCGEDHLHTEIETVYLAKENKIPLLVTDLSMYESCGLLFDKGLSGGYDSQ